MLSCQKLSSGCDLTLSNMSKNFSRLHFEIFFSEICFGISCKLSLGDNLHEMSEPISWKKYQFVVCWSSAEIAQRLVMVYFSHSLGKFR